MDMYEYLYFTMRDRAYRKNPEIPLRRLTYFEQMMIFRVSMFEWECPDSVQPAWVERYLATTGAILAGRKDGKILITSCPARMGDLDEYGDGTDGLGIPRNGDPEITGRIGETVAICYNNTMRCPDLDLLYYPDIMAQIDKSMQEIIEQCRIAPLLCAENSITEQEIRNVLQRLRAGEPQVITSDTTLKSLQKLRDGQGVYSIHLVDPNLTHNAQYLAELWDVMLRRFCNTLGIDTRKTTKHAQVSTAEATGMNAVSWVIPLDMLKNRQEFCRTMQEITGETWSVRFSDAWQIEFERYKNADEMGVADNGFSDGDAGETVGDSADDSNSGNQSDNNS